MAPTLQDGCHILARRTSGRVPAKAEIVVFRVRHSEDVAVEINPAWRVKRVAAVAGDLTPLWLRGVVPSERIPEGYFAVQGDGPKSEDSKQLGCIHVADLVGSIPKRLVRARLAATMEGIGRPGPAQPCLRLLAPAATQQDPKTCRGLHMSRLGRTLYHSTVVCRARPNRG